MEKASFQVCACLSVSHRFYWGLGTSPDSFGLSASSPAPPSLLGYLLNCFQLHCFRGGAVCPGTVLMLQLLNYLRLLWSQDLIHYLKNLRMIFSLFLRDPPRSPSMFLTCSLFSQPSSQVSATLLAVPSSCLWQAK